MMKRLLYTLELLNSRYRPALFQKKIIYNNVDTAESTLEQNLNQFRIRMQNKRILYLSYCQSE
jgi:hypothetical protein